MTEDLNAKPWGTFRDFLTWRDWMGAFSLGAIFVVYLFNPFHTSPLLRTILLVAIAAGAVREFLTFRRKLRALMNIVEPHGA